MLPCLREKEWRELVVEDIESPRRRLDSVLRKSEDAEPVLVCKLPTGVAGGVRAPLGCMVFGSWGPIVEGPRRVGDSGGVDSVLVGSCLR